MKVIVPISIVKMLCNGEQVTSLLCYAFSFLTFVCFTCSDYQRSQTEESLLVLLKHLAPWGFNPHGGSKHYCNTSKNNCNETAKAQSPAKFSHKNGLSNM